MTEKRIDEDWKQRAEIEKAKDSAKAAEASKRRPGEAPKAAFTTHLLELQMQALFALGDVEHPVTGRREQNLEHARYVIDTIGVLADKTRGNLAREEEAALRDVLAALQMRFVEVAGIGAPATAPAQSRGGSGGQAGWRKT